jgi:hypothetical protein
VFGIAMRSFEDCRIGGVRSGAYGQGALFPECTQIIQRHGLLGACLGMSADWLRRIIRADLRPGGLGNQLRMGISVFDAADKNDPTRPARLKRDNRIAKMATLQKLLLAESKWQAEASFWINAGQQYAVGRLLIDEDEAAALSVGQQARLPHLDSNGSADVARLYNYGIGHTPPDHRQRVVEDHFHYISSRSPMLTPSVPEIERLRFLWNEGMKKAAPRQRGFGGVSIVGRGDLEFSRFRENLPTIAFPSQPSQTHPGMRLPPVAPQQPPPLTPAELDPFIEKLWPQMEELWFKQGPRTGGLIVLEKRYSSTSHALAFYTDSAQRCFLFEPNYGEYMISRARAKRFLAALWEDDYREKDYQRMTWALFR